MGTCPRGLEPIPLIIEAVDTRTVDRELDFEVRVVEAAILHQIEFAGGNSNLYGLRAYPHLGLAILDAVLPDADHAEAMAHMQRYCIASPFIRWSARFDTSIPEHDTDRVLAVLDTLTQPERTHLLGRCADGTYRADLVLEATLLLQKHGIRRAADLHPSSDPEIGEALGQLPGAHRGLWRDIQLRTQACGAVAAQPVGQWVQAVLFRTSLPPRAIQIFEQAVANLQGAGNRFSVPMIEQLIWRDALLLQALPQYP